MEAFKAHLPTVAIAIAMLIIGIFIGRVVMSYRFKRTTEGFQVQNDEIKDGEPGMGCYIIKKAIESYEAAVEKSTTEKEKRENIVAMNFYTTSYLTNGCGTYMYLKGVDQSKEIEIGHIPPLNAKKLSGSEEAGPAKEEGGA